MPSEVTREEFESRVGVVEREVEDEKMVTRHILEQTRRNSDDLAAIKTRLDRVEGNVGGSLNRATCRAISRFQSESHKIAKRLFLLGDSRNRDKRRAQTVARQ